ncbi:MAG TPA: ABC transporter permease [Bacillota bacterium]|nr:ABC transporter permease [Bacillota bacterium]
MLEGWLGPFVLASLRAATPLIFCALSVVLAERAGVVHIGVEGVMLSGALAGLLGVVYFGDAYLGILLSVLVGMVTGLLLAFITVYLPADQIVTGIVFNLFSLGMTSFVFRLAAENNAAVQALIPGMPAVVLGLSPFMVMAIIFTVFLWWFLFRTGPGLKIRSMGEDAHAAHAAGINIIFTRMIVLTAAAVLSALGGAALTIGWVRSFTDNITLGRGFIALAAAYCGRWNPLLAAVACIIFGAGEALAFRAQAAGTGLNPHYYLMIPYVLTLLVVAVAGKGRAPADVGKPYLRR